MKTPSKISSLRCLAFGALVGGAVAFTPAAWADNEDEWYDPTDWFDGNNIEADDTYDYTSYDYDYDYGFADDTYDYGTDWSRYDRWDGMWDADFYDEGYWDDYEWYDSYDRVDDDVSRVYTFSVFTLPTNDTGTNARSSSTAKSGKSNQAAGSQASKNKSGSDSNPVAQLSGKIEGVREMKLKRSSGATGTYTLANIRLDNGKNTIVNLGRSSQLEARKLKKGDSIQALGRKGQIAGKTVFVAHKLKSNGKTIDANPVIRLNDQQTVQNDQQKVIKGTVASVSESAGADGHTVLNLKLENGQTANVDLGPAASLERIGLDAGESVTVRGRTQQKDGRQVLIPDLMKIEGEKVAAVSE